MFERRGKPTDRMKSEEELAKEEIERLEKLEVCMCLCVVVCNHVCVQCPNCNWISD